LRFAHIPHNGAHCEKSPNLASPNRCINASGRNGQDSCDIAESLIDGGAGKPNSAFPINVPIVPERKMNMSTLKAEALAREFHYNGVRIPDPGPELTVEQVRDLL
jgi:hypothetical protein